MRLARKDIKKLIAENTVLNLLEDINKLSNRNMMDVLEEMKCSLNPKRLLLTEQEEEDEDEETPEEEGGETGAPESGANDAEQETSKTPVNFPSEVPDVQTQLEYIKQLDRDIQDVIEWLRDFRTEITGLRSGDASVPQAEAPDGLGATFDPDAAQGDPDDPLAGAGGARQTGFTAAQKEGLLKYGKEWLKSSVNAPLPIAFDESLGILIPEMLFWFGVDPVAAYNKYVNPFSKIDIQAEIEKSKKTPNPIATFSKASRVGQILGELAMLAKDPPSGGDQSKIAMRAILGRDTPYGSPGELQSAINTSDATKKGMLNALEKKEPYKIDNYYFSDGSFPDLLYQLMAAELVKIQQTEGLTGEMAQKMTEESPIIQVALFGSGQSNMEINMSSLQDAKKTGSIIVKKLLDSFPNPEGVRDNIEYMILAARSEADKAAGTSDPTAKIYMELIGRSPEGEEGGEPSDIQKQASADQEVKKVLQSASKLNTKALAFLPDEKMKKVFDALSGMDGGAALTSIAVNPRERQGAQPVLQQAYLRYFAEKDQQFKKILDEIEKEARIKYKRIESEGGEEFETLEELGWDEEDYVLQSHGTAFIEKAEELFNDQKVKRYNSLGQIDRFKFEVNIFKDLISKGVIDGADVEKLLGKKGEKDIFRSDKLAKMAFDYALQGDDALKENKKPTIKKSKLLNIVKEEILMILEQEGFLSKIKNVFSGEKEDPDKPTDQQLSYNYRYIQTLYRDVGALGEWIKKIREEVTAIRAGEKNVPTAEEPKSLGGDYGI
jgi:hypothetical protein